MLDPAQQIVLAAGRYRACLAPAAGARLASLTWRGDDAAHDLVVPLDAVTPFDPQVWPKAGAFPMAPFSNRLSGTRFLWGEREIEFARPPGGASPLHGFAHRMRWQVLSTSAHAATLRHLHDGASEGWPWPFELTLQVALDEAGAEVRLRLTNRAAEAAPAGLGWHPYHRFDGCKNNPSAQVRFTAHTCRAVGPGGAFMQAPSPAPRALREFGLQLADLAPQTTACEDWTGQASLPLAQGARLAITCRNTDHVILHVPAGSNYLCLEPVTLLPGALQCYAPADAARMIALAPQSTREISWRCAVVEEPCDESDLL